MYESLYHLLSYTYEFISTSVIKELRLREVK